MDLVAQALADATRRRILLMLRDAQLTAGTVARAFDVSRPAISRHLRVLREAGLVIDEPEGRKRVYRLELCALDELEKFLAELRDDAASRWERRFMALETEVHRTKRDRKRTAASRTRGANRDRRKRKTA